MPRISEFAPVGNLGSGSEEYISLRPFIFRSKPVYHHRWRDDELLDPELAVDPPPPPPRGNFVHYDFLKLHYIRHKIKTVSPLRVAALTSRYIHYPQK